MRTIISYLNNLLMPLIPESKCFGLKRFMWRMAGAKIGKNVKISSSCTLLGAGKLTIGDNTWIGYQVLIVSSSNIVIGKNVDIAPRVYIGTGSHEIDVDSDRIAAKDISKNVEIGDGCWIAANAIILPGVQLGNKCVVAAGAVVTRSCSEDKILLAGMPAKILKRYN